MEDLLNECEVDEDSRGALLGQLNKRMEYGEAMAEETLQKIRDETNEHLKFIVAEHSKWSRLYNEIKYKAQIEDSKTRKQMAKTVVVQIHDIQMKELQFVQTFKPGGHFCDDVLEIFRLIWKESWKPDTIMLSRGAVDQLLGVDNRSGFLEREFKDCTIAEIKTIFVPFISSDHCSLVVVEPDIRLITVLDSLFDLEESTKRHERLISALKSYLSSLGLECTDFLSSTPRVQKQKNLDDCGFHMLLFIMRYKSGNYKNIDEDEILICRQHTAWFLLEHEDNVLRGTFTKGHSKRRLEDKDRGENKKQKVHQKEKNQEAEKSNEDQDQDQQGEVSDQDPDQDQDQDQQGKGNDGKKETTKKGNSKKKNKSLDGRSVKDALLAPIRKVEVVKGGCSVVSPFTKNDTWTQNLGDEELRLQLWKKIVLNDEFKSVTLMRLHKVTRVTDGWHLSGHDISKSFGAKSCCQDILVSFFIQCLLADEVSHGDDTVGYRIFLDPKISELLLASKDAFNINSVVEELKLQYTDQQILKARHILLPVCHDSHWTVYVINKNFGQIDILDSSWATVEVKRKNHRTIAGVIRSKLSDAILLITDKHPKFSEWSMPIIPASSIA
ncbi:uncharacterized protein LOC110431063 [Sorghum bicolor]|uniref:uncharacterized protein LOC110431063 n=1 Tax=Sorghum bicolor TaxID=4558 RepID=UPI000B423D6B|nr:uncharacterized protein LOC110431063 [Sorghum bicolor]|eukprot:XP_021305422.1 uncharacterized protein LOC110431063 [Sorghum bicolor]